ncbi:putative capsid decoration protein [Pseudomonas phage phi15]|uniref:Putative capsid decoration protein n=1 Tax=Pseudomonas phage phi15 TaxID=988656 RepID=F0V6Z8_9CAUD|nr:putative capsid decoration protein [Pseudomonas phage phi15]CBZ42010.1 putative capsid decoration protein [Pseudomonas phage phi15]
MTLDVGASKALTVAEGVEVVWSSSDDLVATVTDGLVSAVSSGKANVTATYGDLTATCVVTVR